MSYPQSVNSSTKRSRLPDSETSSSENSEAKRPRVSPTTSTQPNEATPEPKDGSSKPAPTTSEEAAREQERAYMRRLVDQIMRTKTPPQNPVEPSPEKPTTKEDIWMKNMMFYGRPTRPPPDDEWWKWELDEDGTIYYNGDGHGYDFYDPDWFEEEKED